MSLIAVTAKVVLPAAGAGLAGSGSGFAGSGLVGSVPAGAARLRRLG